MVLHHGLQGGDVRGNKIPWDYSRVARDEDGKKEGGIVGGGNCRRTRNFLICEKLSLLSVWLPDRYDYSVDTPKHITIQDLYPELSPEEQKEAEENLRQYAELLLRIYTRLVNDACAPQDLQALTASQHGRRMGSR